MRMIDFNLQEEVRDGFRVSAQMKKVWQVETDLLAVFTEVCRKENLRFWVDGGSLLGTIRHHGFIPWDDDVDVCMPRADYDRLVANGDRLFTHPYFLQTAYVFCKTRIIRRKHHIRTERWTNSYFLGS